MPDDRAAEAGAGGGTLTSRVMHSRAYRALAAVLVENDRVRLFALALLPVAWALIMNLGPLYQMLRLSFLEAYPLTAGREPVYTLANYMAFLSEPIFLTPFLRTWIFSLTVTLTTLVVVYPVAYFLAKVVPANRQVKYLLLLLVPFWTGEIIRNFAMILLLGNRGALNLVLIWLGISDRPTPFLYTYFSLATGVIYLSAMYMLLPIYSSLEKIPGNLNEAARDLGANSFRTFLRVTLPLSRDGIVAGCVLTFLVSAGSFAAPLLLGGPGTTLFAETIASFFHGANDKWPYGAAFSVILLLSALAGAGLFQWLCGSRATRLL